MTETLFQLEPQFNRGMVDATPPAVALALAALPKHHTNLRAIVEGEASLSSGGRQSYRTIPQTLAILRKIPGLVVSDRNAGGRRVLVLRAPCVLHDECGKSLEMAQRCAEYEYGRDPEAWLKATLAVGRRW
jgi:hypothetical protein